MKTGLVLEGGAMRGIYTAGVLDVFLENQIHFDGVIGVSAGALHGCSFVSGQKGRSIRYYKKYRNDKHFMSLWSLVHTGEVVGNSSVIMRFRSVWILMIMKLFFKSDTAFYAVCTNLETGKAEYIRITDMLNQVDVMRLRHPCPMYHGLLTGKAESFWTGAVQIVFRSASSREWGIKGMWWYLPEKKVL